MSHPSKRKGTSFERECVQVAKRLGLDSERMWGSDGRSRGLHKDVDITIEGKTVQCKRRKLIPSWIFPHHVDAQLIRGDRTKALVVLRYEDYLSMLKEIKTQSASASRKK